MSGPGANWIGEEEKREVMEVLDSGWLFRYGDPKTLTSSRRYAPSRMSGPDTAGWIMRWLPVPAQVPSLFA